MDDSGNGQVPEWAEAGQNAAVWMTSVLAMGAFGDCLAGNVMPVGMTPEAVRAKLLEVMAAEGPLFSALCKIREEALASVATGLLASEARRCQ